MLVPNARPPLFSLPEGTGRETSLAEFLGHRRIVLAFSPDRASLDAFSADADGLNERDIIVLVILPPDHARPSPSTCVLTDHGGRVAAAYGVPPGEVFFCLIGKDGTVKRTDREILPVAEMFKTVDAMPMRRREIRAREGEG